MRDFTPGPWEIEESRDMEGYYFLRQAWHEQFHMEQLWNYPDQGELSDEEYEELYDRITAESDAQSDAIAERGKNNAVLLEAAPRMCSLLAVLVKRSQQQVLPGWLHSVVHSARDIVEDVCDATVNEILRAIEEDDYLS